MAVDGPTVDDLGEELNWKLFHDRSRTASSTELAESCIVSTGERERVRGVCYDDLTFMVTCRIPFIATT
jgi:hypothetical protein